MFDSDTLYRDLHAVCEGHGLRPEALPLDLGLIPPERKLFSFFMLLRQSGIVAPDLLEVLLREVRTYIQENAWRYVFPDVQTFLTAAKLTGSTIHVLTYGDIEFQLAKLAGSRLLTRCDGVVVTAVPKWLYDSLFSSDPTWFFDDNPREIDQVKRRHPGIVAVEVKRPGTKYFNVHSATAALRVGQLLWPLPHPKGNIQ